MADNEEKNGQEAPPDPAQEAQKTESDNAMSKNDPVNVGELPENVQHLIKSLRSEAQQRRETGEALQSEFDALKSKIESQETERLEANQEWEKLATQRQTTIDELQPRIERVEALEGAVEATVQKILKDIPEELHSLMEHMEDPLKKLDWLNKNAEKLRKKPTPPLDGGQRSEVEGKQHPTYKPRMHRKL
jgi:chromosome segregation ATPase